MLVLKSFVVYFGFSICTIGIVCGRVLVREEKTSRENCEGINKIGCSTIDVSSGSSSSIQGVPAGDPPVAGLWGDSVGGQDRYKKESREENIGGVFWGGNDHIGKNGDNTDSNYNNANNNGNNRCIVNCFSTDNNSNNIIGNANGNGNNNKGNGNGNSNGGDSNNNNNNNNNKSGGGMSIGYGINIEPNNGIEMGMGISIHN